MTTTKLPHPTLLRYPGWWRGRAITSEQILPGQPEAYEVVEADGWTVTSLASGQIIYQGAGPVVVVTSPAPF